MSLKQIASRKISHYILSSQEQEQCFVLWEKMDLDPFNELIVTWNASRPKGGCNLIEISLHTSQGWTPFMKYAEWGENNQKTFKEKLESYSASVFQDCAETLSGTFANGFRIKVSSSNGYLKNLISLHACTTDGIKHCAKVFTPPKDRIEIYLPQLSQFGLGENLEQRICSPTSTTAVIRYLKKSDHLDPVLFATKVRDFNFDIYGNWVLNAAQAAAELGPNWRCYAARLFGLNELLSHIQNNHTPVVISIRGPIPGSPLPYEQGHLMVILGFDPASNEILCMDPAFPQDTKSPIRYSSQDLETAWNRRGLIAYVFQPAQ